MTSMVLPLLWALTGSLPGGAHPAGAAAEFNVCPAETEQARRIVTRYSSSDEFSPMRARDHVTGTTPDRVQLLTDTHDAAVCKQLTQVVHQHSHGNLAGTLPAFYKAEGYYYAVLSRPPKRYPATPGHVHIQNYWVTLLVLDDNLKVIANPAM